MLRKINSPLLKTSRKSVNNDRKSYKIENKTRIFKMNENLKIEQDIEKIKKFEGNAQGREEKITKELAQKLMEIKGECRGENIKIDWDYVIHNKGKEGLFLLEEKMAELGYPLKYKDIKPMDFYPIGLDALSMLSIRDILKLDEIGMGEMGASAVKFSLLAKVFFKYFVSLKMIAGELPRMWPRHYTVGTLELPEYSDEKKWAIIRLKDFNIHPELCAVFKGYFRKSTEMLVNSKVIIEETKCVFRGDGYHEFLLKW